MTKNILRERRGAMNSPSTHQPCSNLPTWQYYIVEDLLYVPNTKSWMSEAETRLIKTNVGSFAQWYIKPGPTFFKTNERNTKALMLDIMKHNVIYSRSVVIKQAWWTRGVTKQDCGMNHVLNMDSPTNPQFGVTASCFPLPNTSPCKFTGFTKPTVDKHF